MIKRYFKAGLTAAILMGSPASLHAAPASQMLMLTASSGSVDKPALPYCSATITVNCVKRGKKVGAYLGGLAGIVGLVIAFSGEDGPSASP